MVLLSRDKKCNTCLIILIRFIIIFYLFIYLFFSYNKFNVNNETNSSWLIFQSIKALEGKKLDGVQLFVTNSILSCFVFFFLTTDLYFLIPAIIKEIFIAIAELAIPTGILTNEARAEIKTYPATSETRISIFSV